MPPQTVDRDLDNARRRATHTQTGLDAKNEAGDEHAGNALFAGRRARFRDPAPSTWQATARPREALVVALFGGRTRGYSEGEPGIFAGWAPRVRHWSSRVAPKATTRAQQRAAGMRGYGGGVCR